MIALEAQLPGEFVSFANELAMARQTWQLFGISYSELIKMDPYDQEQLKLILELYA